MAARTSSRRPRGRPDDLSSLAARLVEATPAAIVCVDDCDRVVFVNPAAVRILHHGRRALGLHWPEARGPALADDESPLDEGEDPLARARRLGRRVEAVSIGLEVPGGGDQHAWFHVDAGSLLGEDCSEGAAFLVLRDITPHRRLAHLLERSRAEHLKLLDGLPDLVLRLDAKACIRSANRRAARLFGLRPPDLVGRRCGDVGLPPDVQRRVERTIAEVVTGGRARSAEFRVRRGRRRREFEATFIPETVSGRLTGVVVVARDVTRTRGLERRLRFMADNMVDMISVLSPDGRFEYVSPSHQVQLGVDAASLVGAPAGVLIGADELPGITGAVERAIAAGQESVRLTYPYRHPANGQRWLESIVRLVYDGGAVSNVVITTRDVTAQHEAEEEARRLETRLRELSAHVESVAENAARTISRRVHDDLGQTLTVLKSDAVWLRARLGPAQPALRAKAEEMLQLIEETVQTARSISRELQPLILDDLGLAAALQWQAVEFSRRTGLRCTVECSPEEPEVAAPVARRLFLIAQEALSNVERQARASLVRISLKLSGDELTMAISDDDGHILQAPARRSERSLGLLLMEERAAAVGGRLAVRADGRGTRVDVVVPLDTAASHSDSAREPS